jgi:hypothetical protein
MRGKMVRENEIQFSDPIGTRKTVYVDSPRLCRGFSRIGGFPIQSGISNSQQSRGLMAGCTELAVQIVSPSAQASGPAERLSLARFAAKKQTGRGAA